MLRDNLAGLIEPMVDRAGAHLFGGHPNEGRTGGCSRSTELPIVALKRSWRHIFRWETGRRAEKRIWLGFAVTTEAQDSRAVDTAPHMSHRTIDPQCLENPRPEGAESTLTENVASPFQAEPTHYLDQDCVSQRSGETLIVDSDHLENVAVKMHRVPIGV
jgi:hypothetical protein